MRVVITGSSGFIGSYLSSNLEKSSDIEFQLLDINLGVDICDWNQVRDIKADVIVHLANKSFVPDSYEKPKEFYQVNIQSTLNMLELSRLNNARLIYLSSYVYGHPDYLPIDENHPIKAFNPYAQSKVICEDLCRGYARDFKVPITIFRPFNIYGKGQNENFLIPSILDQIKKGSKVVIKDERPKRDYIHVLDVVSAIEHMLSYKQSADLEIYNLGSGLSYSVKEVVGMIAKTHDQDVDLVSLNEYRPNEVLDTIANIDKLLKTGWNLKYSLAEGLKLL